jgi:hypothetical protein
MKAQERESVVGCLTKLWIVTILNLSPLPEIIAREVDSYLTESSLGCPYLWKGIADDE